MPLKRKLVVVEECSAGSAVRIRELDTLGGGVEG